MSAHGVPLCINDLWRAAAARLDSAGVDAPTNTARLLLAHVLGKSKAWVAAHGSDVLSPQQAQALREFDRLLNRLIAREPLFYVLGEREFYGLSMRVTPDVLIPRPETEMLVELSLDTLKGLSPLPSPAVVDIGTGSGAVAIAVAYNQPQAHVIATDVSLPALRVAQENAVRHQVQDRVQFVQIDLLSAFSTLPPVITANLPYVAREEVDALPPEIRCYEPRVALDGGYDGIELIRRLLKQVTDLLARCNSSRHGCHIFLEIGASQGSAVLHAAQQMLPQAHISVTKDLNGLDRVLCVQITPQP